MTGLQWTNATVLAAAATMALMLGVVCLLYGVYLDQAPQLRESWPVLTRTALLFTALTVVAAVTFFGELRQKAWHWYAQGALVLSTVSVGWLLWNLLTA